MTISKKSVKKNNTTSVLTEVDPPATAELALVARPVRRKNQNKLTSNFLVLLKIRQRLSITVQYSMQSSAVQK